MKLRNKKTGEIGYLIVGKDSDHYIVANDEWHTCGIYDSLADINEEWEDYDEPKSINEIDVILDAISEYCDCHSYYSEDLEKIKILNIAEEKLKAWKRLRDKGIEFYGWRKNQTGTYDFLARWRGVPPIMHDIINDLDLLFGGQE